MKACSYTRTFLYIIRSRTWCAKSRLFPVQSLSVYLCLMYVYHMVERDSNGRNWVWRLLGHVEVFAGNLRQPRVSHHVLLWFYPQTCSMQVARHLGQKPRLSPCCQLLQITFCDGIPTDVYHCQGQSSDSQIHLLLDPVALKDTDLCKSRTFRFCSTQRRLSSLRNLLKQPWLTAPKGRRVAKKCSAELSGGCSSLALNKWNQWAWKLDGSTTRKKKHTSLL